MKNFRKPLSRHFPAHHPKKGQQTFFVEKICKGIMEEYGFYMPKFESTVIEPFIEKGLIDRKILHSCIPKYHTCREGHKVSVGDTITFYLWSERPYRSSQIIIPYSIEVKKVFDIEINKTGLGINGKYIIKGEWINTEAAHELASNDGFEYVKDMLAWFQYPKPFKGQIICFNENIKY